MTLTLMKHGASEVNPLMAPLVVGPGRDFASLETLGRLQDAAQGDAELGVDNVVFTCANYRWRDRQGR